jgi:uncharacterized repeat protein (TIGR03803 family)
MRNTSYFFAMHICPTCYTVVVCSALAVTTREEIVIAPAVRALATRLPSLSFFVVVLTLGMAEVAQGQTSRPTAILHNFLFNNDGGSPEGSLLQSGSVFYGLTQIGGMGTFNGTLYQFDPSNNSETLLHSFSGGLTDGAEPVSSVVQIGSNLYGVTVSGGNYHSAGRGGSLNYGTIFQYNLTTKNESMLYSFTGGSSDGSNPWGALLQSGGNLYGTTSTGGADGVGTVFQYNLTTGAESTLHNFAGGTTDGATPYGSLLQSGSDLYGLTSGGGGNGDGTIFDYNLATNTEHPIYSFAGGANDGAVPTASLIQSGSILYGTTDSGGADNLGTIFQYNLLTNTESVLYSFAGGPNDGADPDGSSLILSGSTLYGMTYEGGLFNQSQEGVVFEYDLTTDTEHVLHFFAGDPTDGGKPAGDLTLSGSILYGTTLQGGTTNAGVIFSISVPEPATAALITLPSILLLSRRQHRV